MFLLLLLNIYLTFSMSDNSQCLSVQANSTGIEFEPALLLLWEAWLEATRFDLTVNHFCILKSIENNLQINKMKEAWRCQHPETVRRGKGFPIHMLPGIFLSTRARILASCISVLWSMPCSEVFMLTVHWYIWMSALMYLCINPYCRLYNLGKSRDRVKHIQLYACHCKGNAMSSLADA